jgi:hypothetical protein
VTTPLAPGQELKLHNGLPNKARIEEFSSKLGSAQYATTITRPDAARATAKLAQFLTNPGPQHIDAIDRVTVYLYWTRHLAIEYGLCSGLKSVELASDTSYGDNTDRKSSSGYICQIYGGPVDWKASKQRTVTTSTTEAELLALSDAARSVQYTMRLLTNLGFRPSHHIILKCDNQQTVNLISNANVKLHTKLRHVDIYSHWPRQEVSEGRIHIEWVPTGQMAADGLTKALSSQNHEKFVGMLRMQNIRSYIDN